MLELARLRQAVAMLTAVSKASASLGAGSPLHAGVGRLLVSPDGGEAWNLLQRATMLTGRAL